MKTHTNNEAVIVEGFRTPFVRSGHDFKDMPAEELGAYLLRELLERTNIPRKEIEEVILSNITSSPDISNIAHTIALSVGLPYSAHATTMRTMSAIEPLVASANKIRFGSANTLIVGGVESISNLPILLGPHLTKIIKKILQSKTWKEKVKQILFFKFSDIILKFTDKTLFRDAISGISEGHLMEKLSKDFHISREEQDNFALASFQKAKKVQKKGIQKEEVVPVFPPTDFELVEQDTELEREISTRYLSKLKPCFDPDYGTVTSGNSSFPADGAVLFLIMNKNKAKSLGYNPLATIHSFARIGGTSSESYYALVHTVEKLLKQAKLNIQDIDLLEVDETYSAKALAFLKIFNSASFNVNGGALALGNALSAGSARMVLSLSKELKRKKKEWGLVMEARQSGHNVILLRNEL